MGRSLFVLDRPRWESMRGLGAPFNGSVIVAESDETLTLMRFKELTKEET
jgi:hypothetical protein